MNRPSLLNYGMVGAGILGMVVFGSLILAMFDIGNFSIAGEDVSGPEFLRRAGLLLALLGGLLFAITYTLADERASSRLLMITFWLVVGIDATVTSLTDAESGNLDITWMFMLAVAVWYLYFKPNVAAYYGYLSTLRHRAMT